MSLGSLFTSDKFSDASPMLLVMRNRRGINLFAYEHNSCFDFCFLLEDEDVLILCES